MVNARSALCPDHLMQVQAPQKPLLIYDGECHFCWRWVLRWQQITEDRVDCAPFQNQKDHFAADIPVSCFQKAVRLVEPDGRVSGAAEAVCRLYSYGRGMTSKWPLWCYKRLPAFAPITEFGYALVAGHRELASRLTTLLWGKGDHAACRPTFYHARSWFLRWLAVVYLIAFVSFWGQAAGLIGEDGILPLSPWLAAVKNHFGTEAYRLFPTLCWFNASNEFIQGLCAAGVALSLLLFAQVAPVFCLIGLWALYLSLTVAGQIFMSFQWDTLLLETGFLSIFLAPLRWWPTRRSETPLAPGSRFLLQWLLFRLVFMSGVVKLTSGDESWWNLSALHYHYETQPLPTPLAWWAHQAPSWFQAASVLVLFAVELILPFFLFGPRRVRLAGAIGLITLQALIALTGNYGFFNLLTIGLCLLAVDDAAWPRLARFIRIPGQGDSSRRAGNLSEEPGIGISKPAAIARPARGRCWPSWVVAPVVCVTLIAGLPLLWDAFFPQAELPVISAAYGYLEPFRSLNGYGLFRVMTRTRPEIIVEGSADGTTWIPYEFKYKIGDLRRAPPIVAPFQPRLDWQMWFAALDDVGVERWLLNFLERLLQGSPAVLNLLQTNPFPEKPPRYVRARLFQYHFTDLTTRDRTGAWWTRDDEQTYCPPLTLETNR
ncbi:MAG: lipase maturation factor family protein [Verrucomicrobia bacterium]|nr:lipase maturation factor family protein [Verrucomicrobiota bacterium]